VAGHTAAREAAAGKSRSKNEVAWSPQSDGGARADQPLPLWKTGRQSSSARGRKRSSPYEWAGHYFVESWKSKSAGVRQAV
jgi:hypothetical protein